MARLTDSRSPWFTRFASDEVGQITFPDLSNPYNRYMLLTSDQRVFINWLQDKGLLTKNPYCQQCSAPCTLTKRSKNIDKFTWQCQSRHETSVRVLSIFDHSHVYLQDILNFIISYAEGSSLSNCSVNSGMAYKNTSVEWAKTVRELYGRFYVHDIEPIKFNGVVEIDESLFGRKTKSHRGRPMGQKIWIFGLVERNTNRVKLFPVDNRKQTTLTEIILNHVETGSTIFSDGWAAYKCLPSMGFHHFVVEHKHAFKAIYRDTSTGEIQEVHTNRIEGAWKHAKEHFKRINGTTISNFEGHLMEVMFRNWNRQSPVSATLERIVKCYNGVDKYERFAGPFFSSWYQSRRPEPNDTISRRDSSSDEESSSEGCLIAFVSTKYFICSVAE